MRAFCPEFVALFEVSPLPRNLEAALRDCSAKRVEVRRSALRDLVRHANGEARARVVGALKILLASDKEVEIRALAAVVCADAGIIELWSELMLALDDQAPRVTQMALLALGELATTVTDAEVAKVRSYLTSELPALRYQAISTLYRFRKDESTAQLLQSIEDPDAEIRWLGLHLLDEWLGTSDGVGSLLAQVGEPAALAERMGRDVPHVRAEAGLLLLRWDSQIAFAMLETLLDRPKGLEAGQLEGLIERFGTTGCRQSIPWLKRHARRGWFEGRLGWVALLSLARLGDAEARQAIVEELRASSLRSQARALEAVRQLRLAEAVTVLEAMTASGKGWALAEEAQAILTDLRRGP